MELAVVFLDRSQYLVGYIWRRRRQSYNMHNNFKNKRTMFSKQHGKLQSTQWC